jgi:predicted ATPase
MPKVTEGFFFRAESFFNFALSDGAHARRIGFTGPGCASDLH